MIAITAEEKNMITEKCPGVHIVRTMKGDSKRHHYYCTEDRRVMALLAPLRGWDVEAPKNRTRKRRGGNYRN